jgi:hypothetical protein
MGRDWEELKMPGECPYSFSDDEILGHIEEFDEYLDYHKIQDSTREYLDTDFEGWIAPERDFVEMLKRNRELFELCLEKMGNGKTREELLRIWPFATAL